VAKKQQLKWDNMDPEASSQERVRPSPPKAKGFAHPDVWSKVSFHPLSNLQIERG
jgi:hypothetical protein